MRRAAELLHQQPQMVILGNISLWAISHFVLAALPGAATRYATGAMTGAHGVS